MEGGGLVGALDGDGLGVAGQLGNGLLAGYDHVGIGGMTRQVLQFEDVAVGYVGVDVETGLEVDVGITARFDYRILTIDFRL
jgi:hypothetical protein